MELQESRSIVIPQKCHFHFHCFGVRPTRTPKAREREREMAMAALTSCPHALASCSSLRSITSMSQRKSSLSPSFATTVPPTLPEATHLHSCPSSCSSSAVPAIGVALALPSGQKHFHCRLSSVPSLGTGRAKPKRLVPPRAKMCGEDPEWNDDDYVALGLGHCFLKNEDEKLTAVFVIEPVPAGGLECMENGGKTCYKHVTGTTLGIALKQDASLLPAEFRAAKFADNFDFRAKCASRTWKRDHPQQNMMHLVPIGGVRSDYNFSLEDKRILNLEVVVTDADNIKQDMSIDVYGRAKEEKGEQLETEIAGLYNV